MRGLLLLALLAAAEVEYCIVGAGPAGLQVANLLQQAGQTYVAPETHA